MTHRLLWVCAAIAIALTATGCGDDAVCTTDVDGDGFGVGCELDCDDNDPLHHGDCFTCSDPDEDGYGAGCDLGVDCAPTDGQHWSDCGLCTGDNDGDGAGGDTCDILDCDDADPDVWTACGACVDGDGDGAHVGCDAYTDVIGPDCDDADAYEFAICGGCVDEDGDGQFTGCDLYDASQPGPDCDDADQRAWSTCSTCNDNDVDGYFAGCDDYLGESEDCDPTSGLHWSDCGGCTDTDLDGAGPGCDLGADCDAADRDVWQSCASCVDGDSDLYYTGCDAYFVRNGPDCDDTNDNEFINCSCVDADGDSYFVACDSYTGLLGPDCNDGNPDAYTTCGTCRDYDGDGRFAGCNTYTTLPGPDCDDFDVNVYTPAGCAACNDTDGDGFYAGCDQFVTLPEDCAPADGDHWSDCGMCTDPDGDDRGPGCDLGDDCDPTSGTHWSDCGLCNDLDDDGYGSGTCDLGGNDCDDTDENRFPTNPDTTVDGTDQNCDLFDTAALFTDNWDDGSMSTQWTTVVGDAFVSCCSYYSSAFYSANLGGNTAIMESQTINTSSCDALMFRYRVRRGPSTPLASEPLVLQYWNGGAWIGANSYPGGVSDTSLLQHSGTIAGVDALHAGFRVRLVTTAGTVGFDDYYVDDFALGCAPDLDGDNDPNTTDCAPTDPDHWNDCGGACTDTDGDDFGPGCDLGADCYPDDTSMNPRAITDTTVDTFDQNCDGHDGPTTTTTYPAASLPLAITDSGVSATGCAAASSVSSAITVADTGTILDVDVTLSIAHARASDLDVFLQYDNGTETACIQLAVDNPVTTVPGADTIANYTSTVFDDEAAFTLDQSVLATFVPAPPFTASFRPESGTLSQVDGLANATTWTLYINDDLAGTSGSLTSWSVTSKYY